MHRHNRSAADPRALLIVALILALPLLRAAAPIWWIERGVLKLDPATQQPVPADDFAALNQGQLKKLATAAFDEMNDRLPGGAGPAIETLIKSWHQTDSAGEFLVDGNGARIPRVTTATADFASVNAGQLKAVAKLFYDRLIELELAVEYPWTGAVNPAGDFAMANMGQAKNLFSFSFALEPPIAWGYGTGQNSVHLEWLPVVGAERYIVERMRYDGGTEQWITFPPIDAPDHELDDLGLQPDTLYVYRVAAQKASQSSLPSDEVWTFTGETGGDGGDGGGGGDDTDTDGDGIPDTIEVANGTDPTKDDSDDDGTLDWVDLHPKDKRRDQSISTKYQHVHDLNVYISNPLLDPAVITIDDDNRVAEAGVEPSTSLDPIGTLIEQMRVIMIVNDIATEASPVLLGEYFDEADGHYFRRWSLQPIGIAIVNGIPKVYGNMTGTDLKKIGNYWTSAYRTVSGNFEISEGTFDKRNVTKESNWHSNYQLLSRGGHLFWTKRVKNTLSEDPPQYEYIQTPVIDDTELTAFQTIRPTETGPAISGLAISKSGSTVFSVTPNDSLQTPPPTAIVLTNPVGLSQIMPSDFPQLVYAINDQQWIVGSKYKWIVDGTHPDGGYPDPTGYEDPSKDDYPDGNGGTRSGRGELGFVWNATLGVQTFHDLLPPQYLRQLHTAIPSGILNNFSETNSPLITFAATELLGPNDGFWNGGAFFWQKDVFGDPLIQRLTHIVGAPEPVTAVSPPPETSEPSFAPSVENRPQAFAGFISYPPTDLGNTLSEPSSQAPATQPPKNPGISDASDMVVDRDMDTSIAPSLKDVSDDLDEGRFSEAGITHDFEDKPRGLIVDVNNGIQFGQAHQMERPELRNEDYELHGGSTGEDLGLQETNGTPKEKQMDYIRKHRVERLNLSIAGVSSPDEYLVLRIMEDEDETGLLPQSPLWMALRMAGRCRIYYTVAPGSGVTKKYIPIVGDIAAGVIKPASEPDDIKIKDALLGSPLWIEGINPGEVVLQLEKHSVSKPASVKVVDRIRFEVNVGRGVFNFPKNGNDNWVPEDQVPKDDDIAKLRHRVEAVSAKAGVAYMQAELHGVRPLVTWKNEPKTPPGPDVPHRDPTSASYWVGLSANPGTVWIQAGQLRLQDIDSIKRAKGAIKSSIYVEVSDSETERPLKTLATPGVDKWHEALQVTINTIGKKATIIVRELIGGKWVDLPIRYTPQSFPANKLNTAAGTYEVSSNINRVPGTPAVPAKIKNIILKDKNGKDMAGFTQNDARVTVYHQPYGPKEPLYPPFQINETARNGVPVAKVLHYNIRVIGGVVELWDKHNWGKRIGLEWKHTKAWEWLVPPGP